MSKYIFILAILVFTSAVAGSTEHEHAIAVTGDPLEKETTPPDTFCYVLTEGEKNKNINAVRIVLLPNNKIAGELIYITQGQPAASGQLKGKIKNDIITADWTFIKNDTSFYSVPVAFKISGNSIFQKPSQVDENGKPYVPEDGEYSFEFKRVGCEYYPG